MTKKIEQNLFSLKNNTYKIIDLFAGVGGIRLGFENIFKDKADFVFSSEIDKFAQQTYQKNFGIIPAGDITKIEAHEIPDHDILLAGFPCQAFSVAGHRKGFEDTRGTLFFDVARVIKYHSPQVVFLENVKGFKNHDNGNTYQVVENTLQDMGYKVFSDVLNSKDFGVPQNRERIYIIAFKNQNVSFKFPQKIPLKKKISDCLTENIHPKYYYNDKPLYNRIKDDITDSTSVYQWRRQYVRENKNKVCPTLTANMGTGGHNVPIVKDKKGIRKLTPRECANFQGFPQTYKLPENIVDSQLYKQFGNSVSINVIESLAKQILNSLENN